MSTSPFTRASSGASAAARRAGIRAAFDVGAASWGLTPLLNKGLIRLDNDVTLFGEVVLPIRFKQDILGSNYTAIGLGVHFGIGF
jgi:hypothetical protein